MDLSLDMKPLNSAVTEMLMLKEKQPKLILGRPVSFFIHSTFSSLKHVGVFLPSSIVLPHMKVEYYELSLLRCIPCVYSLYSICPIKSEDEEEKVNLIRNHLEHCLQLH